MNIVVVDDEFTTLALIERALQEDGHHMRAFSDPREALEDLDDSVELVISDLYMPGMDGQEFFSQVRDRVPEVPFVYLTSADDLATVVELVREGATDLIQKPVRPETLRLRIEQVMREVEHRRTVESIVREQELIRRENQRLVTWRMLYASKDVRQTRQLVDNLSRNVNAGGGFDWVDLLEEMKQEHDDEHYVIPRAVVDLAVGSARTHQELLRRITEIGTLHSADPIEEVATRDAVADWFGRVVEDPLRRIVESRGRRFVVSMPGDARSGGDATGDGRRLKWDDAMMTGVLHELVCNAVKYSPDGTPVTVEAATGTEATTPHLSLRVRNHADTATSNDADGRPIVGVPDAYSEQVFELFYTIEAFPTVLEEERWTDGTGLYFVRTMVRLLDGWAEIRTGVDYTSGAGVPQVIAEVRIPYV